MSLNAINSFEDQKVSIYIYISRYRMIIGKMKRYINQDFHLLPSTLRLHGRELKQFLDAFAVPKRQRSN